MEEFYWVYRRFSFRICVLMFYNECITNGEHRRYDIGDIGDAKPHKELIDFARSIPVAAITAHVVKGPRILRYHDRGLLGPDVVLSHCNELADHPEPDDEMWSVLKTSGASVASTPLDEMGMAHGNPVAFEAVERGVKCGLGAVSLFTHTLTSCALLISFYRTVRRSIREISLHRCASHSNFTAVSWSPPSQSSIAFIRI